MSIDIFKICMQTPKSGKNFWKSQGIFKSLSAGHPGKKTPEEMNDNKSTADRGDDIIVKI